MRIQTEYMSFNNRWMICSSYDFEAHQQRSQRRWCFSQTALLWFEVLPDLSPALRGLSLAHPDLTLAHPGAPRLVVSAPRLIAGAPMCSQVHPMISPALRGVPKPITITPMVLLQQSSEIPVTLKASQNALHGSDTLLNLTHLCLHSTSFQTLLESSSD